MAAGATGGAAGATDAASFWGLFTALTVVSWGLYGVLLHKGQHLMGDPEFGRLKAFLFVGIAYFLIAVLAPIGVLVMGKATWTFSGSGMSWSLLAGAVGAVGAFGVLLAFGAGGSPAVVMSVVFAGAPIVNAVVATTLTGGWGRVRWPFFVGVLLAAVGAFLVVRFKPGPPPKAAAPTAPMSASVDAGSAR